MGKRNTNHQEPRSRKRATAAAALAFAAAAGTLLLAPATAQAEETGDHCVYNVTRAELTCSDTPAAALAADSAGIQATTTLVRLFDQTDYGTANGTFTLTIDGSYTCSAAYSPIEFTVANLGSAGWSNRASSARTYHSCDVKLFDNATATGSSSTWIDNLANLNTAAGGWSNRAGSFQVS